MSVSRQIVVGYGVSLDYRKYHEKIMDDFEEYDDDSDKNVRFFLDGMNGEYLYLINVKISITDDESYEGIIEEIKEVNDVDKEELKRLYKELTGENLDFNNVKCIILNHIT